MISWWPQVGLERPDQKAEQLEKFFILVHSTVFLGPQESEAIFVKSCKCSSFTYQQRSGAPKSFENSPHSERSHCKTPQTGPEFEVIQLCPATPAGSTLSNQRLSPEQKSRMEHTYPASRAIPQSPLLTTKSLDNAQCASKSSYARHK